MLSRHRRRAREIVEPAGPRDWASWAFDGLIVGLILLDVFALVAATEPHMRWGRSVFLVVERTVPIVFFWEYLLRLWACKEEPRYAEAGGRLRYAVTPMALVDLVAIFPVFGYVPGLEIPPALAAIRVFRLLKLVRYFETVHVLGRAVARVRQQMTTLLAALLMLVIVASLLLYAFENERNPQVDSVTTAMWWSVVTMTTVGYGDVVPITPEGRVLAAVLGICGIAMFAIPAGLLGATFTEEVAVQMERTRRRREKRVRRAQELREREAQEASEAEDEGPDVCPHCGGSLEGLGEVAR